MKHYVIEVGNSFYTSEKGPSGYCFWFTDIENATMFDSRDGLECMAKLLGGTVVDYDAVIHRNRLGENKFNE